MRIILSIGCWLLGLASLPAQGPIEAATKARTVFEKHCYACHGKEGANEGGMNFVLNRERLVATRKVVPNDLKASRALKRMVSDEMPPDEDQNGKPIKVKPTKEEIDAVKQWIAAGAPDFAPKTVVRKFISNTDVLDYIHKDLLAANERQRRFLRYFTITHLYNAGLSDDELLSYRVGLSKLVNSLSWGSEVKTPEPVDPAKTIFRIDLRQYGWKTATWDRIVSANPYGVTYKTRTALACYELAQTPMPHVRGDWFVYSASRPPLYHEVLDLPETDRELEKLLHIDALENIGNEAVARAAFNGSGVSRNNRLIERHKSPHGAYWKSYDFAGNTGHQNLFQYPLGPSKAENHFRHDGGEIIFHLPNSLQAYFLTDGEGKRIDKGPIGVVSDPRQADRSVVNGISCMTCHNQGTINKTDQVRDHVEKNPDGFSRAEADTIKALYLPKNDFAKLLKEDADRFKKAVEATGAHLSKTEPVFALAETFEREIDLKAAAAEVGVATEDLIKGLGRVPALARVFGSLRVEGGTVQRQVLVTHFSELTTELIPEGTFRQGGGEVVIQVRGEQHVINLGGGLQLKMAHVGKGKFFMGSPPHEAERNRLHEEQRELTIRDDFYLGIHEVTQAQWIEVMGNNPSWFSRSGGGRKKVEDIADDELRLFPVENLLWADTQLFLKRLNAREAQRNTGWEYRLPREVEWEYACRGGPLVRAEGKRTAPFYFAKPTFVLSSKEANFKGDDPYGDTIKGPFLFRTCKVGSYAPNALGLFDMHGNVSEWCDDFLPIGRAAKYGTRGGSYINQGSYCRAALPVPQMATTRQPGLGFRIARVPVTAR